VTITICFRFATSVSRVPTKRSQKHTLIFLVLQVMQLNFKSVSLQQKWWSLRFSKFVCKKSRGRLTRVVCETYNKALGTPNLSAVKNIPHFSFFIINNIIRKVVSVLNRYFRSLRSTHDCFKIYSPCPKMSKITINGGRSSSCIFVYTAGGKMLSLKSLLKK
jgi:hypothetical protein